MCEEIPFCFQSRTNRLVGIIHNPITPSKIGVLIVVGGPQYRIGSHRQFVTLARYLCEKGIAVMRFDYAAMGDSEGTKLDFETVDEDLHNACNEFMHRVPSTENLVIWGLCDAASAALFYAYQDARIKGLVLVNPWVRTEASEAEVYIKSYYLSKLMDKGFWLNLLTGKVKIFSAVYSFLLLVFRWFWRKRVISSNKTESSSQTHLHASGDGVALNRNMALPERMAQGLSYFDGEVLCILSGNNDYVADEFRQVVSQSRIWRDLFNRANCQRIDYPQANHTFSRSDWKQQVNRWTYEWIVQRVDRVGS